MSFEPENEMGVIVYFAHKIASIDNVSFLSARVEYPDAVLLIDGKEYCTEFEYLSSNFLRHRHDPRKCDLIICWTDDIENKNKLPVWEMSNGECESFVAPIVDEAQKEAWYWEIRARRAEKLALLSNGFGPQNMDKARAVSESNARVRIEERRQNVRELKAKSLTNEAIARELDVSLSTVKTDLKRLNGSAN